MGDRSSEMGGGWRVASGELHFTRNPQRATAQLGLAAAAVLAISATTGLGQSLYESFNYSVPGNVGGTSTATSDATGNNNWATHSNTSGNSGAISLVSGSLSFPSLAASAGNRINIPGANSSVPRDINRPTALTGTPTIVYLSFLVNVANNT